MSTTEELLKQVLQKLNSQEMRLAEIRQRQIGTRGAFEALDLSLTMIEETLEAVARDAAQARETGHRLRGLAAAQGVCVENLLEVALGKFRSADTLQAAKNGLVEATRVHR